jgi:hypothetical protein
MHNIANLDPDVADWWEKASYRPPLGKNGPPEVGPDDGLAGL